MCGGQPLAASMAATAASAAPTPEAQSHQGPSSRVDLKEKKPRMVPNAIKITP